jgi:hypothetical protein
MTLVAMPNVDEAQRTLAGLPDLYIALDHSSHRVLSYVPLLDGADGVCSFQSVHPNNVSCSAYRAVFGLLTICTMLAVLRKCYEKHT